MDSRWSICISYISLIHGDICMRSKDINKVASKVVYHIGIHETCQQKDISIIRNIDNSYLSKVLHILQKENIITRKENKKDKRKLDISLTKKGQIIHDQIAKIVTILESYHDLRYI